MKEGWVIKPLGEIAEFVSGSRPKGGVGQIKSGVLSLGGEHVGTNGYVDISAPKYVPREFFDSNSKGHIQSSDILLCKDGALSGKVAIERGELSGKESMVNEHVFIIRTGKIDQKYLFFYLFSPVGQSLLKGVVTGAAQGGINGKNLRSIPVVFPLAKEEQQRIVAELDLLSDIIEKKRNQLQDLDALSISTYHEIFDSLVSEEKKTIEAVYTFQYGKGNNIPEDKGIYPCYGSNGIVGHHVVYNSEDAPVIGHIGAYAGIVNWAAGKHYVTYNGVICKIKEGFNPIYGYYLLKSQNYINKARRGGAQPFVSYDMLYEPEFIVPPLSLQDEFAERISILEKEKEDIENSLIDIKNLLSCRMDCYFNQE